MKLSNKSCAIAAFIAISIISCTKETVETNSSSSVSTIIATVNLSDSTKVAYSEIDPEGCSSGLKSVWEENDFFYALNGDEAVKFTLVSGAGTTTAIFSAEAKGITESTQWKAVLGSKALASSGSIACTYVGQSAKLSDMGDFDYIVATGTGLTPSFCFDKGNRLSYFIRLRLPAGVRYIEYCTSSSWTVTANANTVNYDNDFEDIHMIDLGSESSAGDVHYLAIPAAKHNDKNNILKGVIITYLNSTKTKSNGNVISLDLSEKGGKIGSLKLSSLALIDRPLATDAISFGATTVVVAKDASQTVTTFNNLNDYILQTTVSPEWAPFNLGANITSPSNRNDLYGEYYCWGEVQSRTSFAADNAHYTYYGGNTVGGIENYQSTWIGPKISYGVFNATSTGTMSFQRISGTKYDAARVKWGSEWRMPTPEELMSFTGGSQSTNDAGATTASGFKSENVGFGQGTYYGQDVPGRKFTKDSKSVFFPHGGRYGTGLAYNGTRGFYWSDSRIRATPSNQSLTNNPLISETTGDSRNYGSQNLYHGLTIRPVRNYPKMQSGSCTSPSVVEEGATLYHGSIIYPNSNVYGFIQDNNGKGIANVTVSDGYSCVSSDANGVYQMTADSRIRTVNLSVPAEYEIPVDDNGKPAFYQAVTLGTSPVEKCFTLKARSSVNNRFTIIAITDEHVNTAKESVSLTRFSTAMDDVQETVTDLADGLPVGPSGVSAGEIIGISIGDQLWDDMTTNTAAVLNEYRGITNTAGKKVPFFFTIGNHDHDNSKSTDYDCATSFVNNFGPTDYSFNIGNAHIVVMDDIIVTGNGEKTVSYKAGFTTEQTNWLKSDIAKVSDKGNKIVVLCVHIPLSNASAGDSGTQNTVMSQLKNEFYSAHVLSGHDHVMKNNYYAGWTAKGGRNITEHTIQSLAGYFWLADVSYTNGSPAGYGVYTFGDKDLYAEYNKVTKEDAGFQFRVYKATDTYNKISAWEEMMYGGARGYKPYKWSNVGSGYVLRAWDASSTNDTANTWTFSLNGSTNMTRVSSAVQDAAAASYVFNTDGIGEKYGDANVETNQIWYGGSSFNSTFTITATHTMPSGWSATYTISNKYVGTSYNGFPYGVRY